MLTATPKSNSDLKYLAPPPAPLLGLYFLIPSKVFSQFCDCASLSKLWPCFSLFWPFSCPMACPCSSRELLCQAPRPDWGLDYHSLLALISQRQAPLFSAKVCHGIEVTGVNQVTSVFRKQETEIPTTPYSGPFPIVCL